MRAPRPAPPRARSPWGAGVVVATALALACGGQPSPWPIAGAASVTTFGYDDLRPGSVRSTLLADGYGGLVAEAASVRGEISGMPLFLDGAGLASESWLAGRRLLLYAEGGELLAVDPASGREYWRRRPPLGRVTTTPVVDRTLERVYFTGADREGRVADPTASNRLRIGLYSMALDGADLEGFELDLDRLLATGPLADGVLGPRYYLTCRTALGLDRRPGSRRVLFGCSILAPADSNQRQYARSHESRGALLVAPLDDDGRLRGPDQVIAFLPSALSDDPALGFDTGIWNTGAGPALLDDGSILIATANGPVAPERGNFGCSVVRLDPTLRPVSAGADDLAFYSADATGYDECHAANNDLSSSSVATVRHHDHYHTAITGKDGRLRVFDPWRLPGGRRERWHEVEASGEIFGQPSIWVQGDQVWVVTGGDLEQNPYRGRRGDVAVATAAQAEYLSSLGYRQGARVGLAARRPAGGEGERELARFYSGVRFERSGTAPAGVPTGPPGDTGEHEVGSVLAAAGAGMGAPRRVPGGAGPRRARP